eukprot:3919730-Pleurochrysis_carterae.AAC.4
MALVAHRANSVRVAGDHGAASGVVNPKTRRANAMKGTQAAPVVEELEEARRLKRVLGHAWHKEQAQGVVSGELRGR